VQKNLFYSAKHIKYFNFQFIFAERLLKESLRYKIFEIVLIFLVFKLGNKCLPFIFERLPHFFWYWATSVFRVVCLRSFIHFFGLICAKLSKYLLHEKLQCSEFGCRTK